MTPVETDVTLLVDARFGVGESPVWDSAGQRLLWCDIPAGTIHALWPDSGERAIWTFDEPVPSFGLAQNGRWVVALRNDIILFDPVSGAAEHVARIDHAKPDMRLNDGKTGPDGAFWVGSMDASADGSPSGKLYRVAPSGAVTMIAEGLNISNGLAWNGAGTLLYHSDSRGDMWIDCWDFDRRTGAVSNRRRLREHDEANGRPDGAACDQDGNYWSAGPGAQRINRFSADGILLDYIEVPFQHPTMPCFGGADMRTMFVTSLDSKSADPGRDGIARYRISTPGVPLTPFGR